MNDARLLPSLVVIAVIGLLPVSADAGFYSGNALFKVCTAERDSSSYLEKTFECVAYISGAVDAFNTTRTANKLKSCIPAGVTTGQLKDATVDYLEANPGDRSTAASTIVFAATRKAWPCAKRK